MKLILPNTAGFAPGSTLSLMMLNPVTGGKDSVGQMTVSADGQTMTSTGLISLGNRGSASSGGPPPGVLPQTGGPTFSDCLYVEPQPLISTPMSMCDGCQSTGNGSAPPANNGGTAPAEARGGALDSDAGLITGEYFLDHQLATYQSQGQNIGIDLQYSSAQADPNPVVQYQFTYPPAGDTEILASIQVSVTVAGVLQGSPITYTAPNGIDGATFNVPFQINASALPTGVYPYTMSVLEQFGTVTPQWVGNNVQGYVNVVNAASDPLGAGWSVGGLQQRLATGHKRTGPCSRPDSRVPSVLIMSTEAAKPISKTSLATTPSSAQIMVNNGMGAFAGSVTASDTVVGTASGDYNGDGKPDLAVVSSSTLEILLNNGTGGFTVGSSDSIPSGYEAKGIVAGNFNGSAVTLAVLLASTSTNAYSVAIYTSTGSGTFGTPVITAAGHGHIIGFGSRFDRRGRLQWRRQERRRLHHGRRRARRYARHQRRVDVIGNER